MVQVSHLNGMKQLYKTDNASVSPAHKALVKPWVSSLPDLYCGQEEDAVPAGLLTKASLQSTCLFC